MSGYFDQSAHSIESRCVVNDVTQDYGNSIANALQLLQSCTKPSIYSEQEMTFGNFDVNYHFAD